MPMAKFMQSDMFDPYVPPVVAADSIYLMLRRRRFEWLIAIGLLSLKGFLLCLQ